MTAATITLNVGTGGDKPLVDTLSTVDGAAAPAGASAQMVKIGHGAASDFKTASAANPLPFVALGNGLISTVNSTAVALGISGVFTGTAEDVTEFSDVRIYVFSDQASATDGLQIQQSSNGTNWDVADPYSIPAASGKVFSVGVSARFLRIVYTNSATAQTAFRLQVKLHKSFSKGSSVRPQDGRTNDNDFEEMLAFSMGYNGASWDRLRSSIANGLAVDVTRISGALPAGANVIGGVTGAFFQATQPVSLATVAVTNAGTFAVQAAATLAAETTKVIGTINLAASQTLAAVTAITNALPTGANTIGAVTGPAAAPLSLDATQTNHTQRFQAVTTLTTLSVANTAVTLTLPAVAAQFHYITRIEIVRVATAALAGTAVLSYTSTNLPTSWARSAGNAMTAGGTVKDVDEVLENPIKSTTVNTATTIVAPAAGAAVLVRITAYYYPAA